MSATVETLKPFIDYFGYSTGKEAHDYHKKPLCSTTRLRG